MHAANLFQVCEGDVTRSRTVRRRSGATSCGTGRCCTTPRRRPPRYVTVARASASTFDHNDAVGKLITISRSRTAFSRPWLVEVIPSTTRSNNAHAEDIGEMFVVPSGTVAVQARRFSWRPRTPEWRLADCAQLHVSTAFLSMHRVHLHIWTKPFKTLSIYFQNTFVSR